MRTSQNLKIKGNIFFKQGKYQEALELYELAIVHNRHFKEAWLNKGLTLIKLDKKIEAIEAFNHAIKIDGTYVKAFLHKEKCKADVDACVSFMIADLKLTDKGEINILEFGLGLFSGFSGYDKLHNTSIQKKLQPALKERHPNTFINSRSFFTKSYSTNFSKYFPSQPDQLSPSFNRANISSYRGQYGGLYTQAVNDDILVLDSPLLLLAIDNKLSSHLAFGEKYSSYRPTSLHFDRSYQPDLAKKIKKEIHAEHYVLKALDLASGNGVILASANELEYVLKILLCKKGCFEKTFQELSKQSNNRLCKEKQRIIEWRKSMSQEFLVEAYVPSKPVIVKGQAFDATMRVAFMMTKTNGSVTCDPIGCYWKLPPSPIDTTNLRQRTISSFTSNHEASAKVTTADQQIVYDQMKRVMPHVFQNLLNIGKNKLIVRGGAENWPLLTKLANIYGRRSNLTLGLHYANRLVKLMPNYYLSFYERGLVYDRCGHYENALKNFNRAIALSNNALPDPFFRRAQTYMKLENLESATQDLQQAISLGGQNTKYREELNNYLYKLSNPKKFCKEIDELLCNYSPAPNILTENDEIDHQKIKIQNIANDSPIANRLNPLNILNSIFESKAWKVDLLNNTASLTFSKENKSIAELLNQHLEKHHINQVSMSSEAGTGNLTLILSNVNVNKLKEVSPMLINKTTSLRLSSGF